MIDRCRPTAHFADVMRTLFASTAWKLDRMFTLGDDLKLVKSNPSKMVYNAQNFVSAERKR